MSASSENRKASRAADRRRTIWKIKKEKTAQWIVIDEQSGRCSGCGHIQKTNGVDRTGHGCILYGIYVVCPLCGAHMIRGGDTECQE